ncbi:hypothetical protein FUAX_16070 [Fulvitalea axinellae]|uniref:Peptidase M28 domain-containing protein n=1 Tax=Fulvitalea axinellae TaxID=1182444 RepID=A0AAU9DE37_9BACT|nr:hypothetical protein FUAX_16070 [Fulvitalea axinellae]
MRRALCLIFTLMVFFLVGENGWAQKNYARRLVNELCSPEYHGRGYVKKGDFKAAQFIASQFDSLGLEPVVGESYFQEFEIPVNTFPDTLGLSLNGLVLRPGHHFLVEPWSGSGKGSFEAVAIQKSDFVNEASFMARLRQAKGKFLVYSEQDMDSLEQSYRDKLKKGLKDLGMSSNPFVAGVLKITTKKLTWGGSGVASSIPYFTVKSDRKPTEVKKVSVAVRNKHFEHYKTRNVIGRVKGTSGLGKTLLIGAHYDHLGRMGSSAYFPGANDNASGTAMLLSLAKYYAENPHDYDVVFVAFGAEEQGLYGSRHFVENPPVDLEKISFMLNLDINGTGDDGITVVNGAVHDRLFGKLESINKEKSYLPEVKSRGEACNSDHCFFHFKGVKSFYVYTRGGSKAYHDVFDTADNLSLSGFDGTYGLLRDFLNSLTR